MPEENKCQERPRLFKHKEKPRFFGCEGDESREAYHLVLKSGIDCDIYLVSDVESPEIRDGYTRYTGIGEIKDFIEERKSEQNLAKELEEEKDILKGIIIETRRFPPEHPSSKHVSLKGLVSLIKFTEPVKDFKGDLNSSLCLKTTYFRRVESGYYWNMWLDNEKGYCICQGNSFNSINEDFSSYSKERLENWQNVAIGKHREYLLKLEDLYWQEGVISKNFYNKNG